MSDMYYISASQAQEKLRQRTHLRAQVEAFWTENGLPFPAELRSGGYAGMGRHVPTFRFEDAVFTLMAESAGLQPTWIGYEQDKFVVQSNVKRSLLRPQLTERTNKHGAPIARTRKLVPNPDWFHGMALGNIRTDDGRLMVDWHSERLHRAVPQARCYDMSHISAHWGGRAENYYTAYLSLFVAHGVLFEDYHGGESGDALDSFTARVFEPAAARVEQLFGVNPLVVALPWWPELALYPSGAWLDDWRSCDVVLRRHYAA